MKLNKAGLDLIKRFEGMRLEAYRDPVGIWTIGYGHTNAAGYPMVTPGMRITEREAEETLLRDLKKYEGYVRRGLTVELNDNQYSALVSFCFNVGPGNFKKSVLTYTNARRFSEVPSRLALYNKAGGRVLRGLTRRRKAEGDLFVSRASTTPVDAPKARGFWRSLFDLIATFFRRK